MQYLLSVDVKYWIHWFGTVWASALKNNKIFMIYIFKQSHCQGLTINAYHDFRKTDTVFKKKGKFRAKFPTLDISD